MRENIDPDDVDDIKLALGVLEEEGFEVKHIGQDRPCGDGVQFDLEVYAGNKFLTVGGQR